MIRTPPAALEALAGPAEREVGRFRLREPTFGALALLEALGSPLAVPGAPGTLVAWAETLYALTRPGGEAAELLYGRGRDAYRLCALAWADSVSNAEAAALLRAAGEAFGRIDAANPAPDSGDGTEEPGGPDPTGGGRTAGSPAAPPRPANASDGASAACSGRCPPPRS